MEDFKTLKVKTGSKQLKIEELGVTWLRRRKPTKSRGANLIMMISFNVL
jgi:hypothetical protein